MHALTSDPFGGLTSQERRVALAVGRGAATKTVARDLTLSRKTVDFHLGNIYRKLGIGSRAELAHLVGRAVGAHHGPRLGVPFPSPLGPLVGRDDDVRRLMGWLDRPGLVTVHGPGGVGKTQLALTAACAARSADDAWFVDLASTNDPSDVAAVVARSLGLLRVHAAAEIAAAMAGSNGLILLDNCEHVLEGVRTVVSHLLASCPSITVLATSRERLGLDGEFAFGVEPLSLEIDEGGVSSAGRLFRLRSHTFAPMFDPQANAREIERVCARLDGLPLAIELVAARLGAFDLSTLERGIRDLAVTGPVREPGDRHNSLAATIEWSYRLLRVGERRALEALSVVNGSFDADTSRAVIGGDTEAADQALVALVDKSLVAPGSVDQGVRYRLLDTLRDFGLDQGERHGQTAGARRRFVDHMVRLVETADADVRGPGDARGHQTFCDEWHNVRHAVATAITLGDVDATSRLLAASLWWVLTRTHVDLDDLFERALAMAGGIDHRLRPTVSAGAAITAALRCDRPRAFAHLDRAIAEDDRAGRTGQPWPSCATIAIGDERQDLLASAHLIQAYAEATGDPFWRLVGRFQEDGAFAYALNHLDLAASDRERLVARIRSDFAEAQRQRNPNGIGYGTALLGSALRRSDPLAAQQLLEKSIAASTPLGIELTATWARRELALVHAAAGRHGEVLALAVPTIRRHLRVGSVSDARPATAVVLPTLVAKGRAELAARALGSLLRDPDMGDVLLPLADTHAAIVDVLGASDAGRLLQLGELEPIEVVAREVADECERILHRPRVISVRRSADGRARRVGRGAHRGVVP